MAAVRTKVEELPESRVRLEIEVPEAEVRHALEHAASDLAGSLKIPGFRKGKVPLPVVTARVGRRALWERAVGSHIESWFWDAASRSRIQPVANPELELGEPPVDGSFHFTATVDVLPPPELAEWTELEVPAPEPVVPAEAVERELQRVAETVAELVPADRPARQGDVVVVDVVGQESGGQRDLVVQVAEGRLIEPLDDAIVGLAAGESKQVEVELDEERSESVDITVKDVKVPVLPPLDDELARAASEFDTLAELREDVERRLREQLEEELETALRESAVDALVAASKVERIEPLIERRTLELWSGLVRSLERRGISAEAYLALSGQSQQDVVDGLRAQAAQAVKRELVLEAVAERLGIDVSDAEVEELVRSQVDEELDLDRVVAELRDRGVFEQLRGDLRLKKALDEVVAGVKRIPVELARAREALWTPEKERSDEGVKIWTPGSKEAP